MSDDLYDQVMKTAFKKLKAAITRDIQADDFDWDTFVEAILEDESPLTTLFSDDTVKKGMVYSRAISLYESAQLLDTDPQEDKPNPKETNEQ